MLCQCYSLSLIVAVRESQKCAQGKCCFIAPLEFKWNSAFVMSSRRQTEQKTFQQRMLKVYHTPPFSCIRLRFSIINYWIIGRLVGSIGYLAAKLFLQFLDQQTKKCKLD